MRNNKEGISIPTPASVNTPWKLIWQFCMALVFIAMTIMSFSYGISGDEIDMNNYGNAILDYFTSFGAEKNALAMPKELDRDGVIHLYGGFFDLVAAIVNKVSPFDIFTTRHILNAWAGFLAIFFASKIALRFIGYRAAVLTTLLMFLAPFFLGHAMNNPKDIPFAAAYIAAIYCFIRFYDKLPNVSWKDYILPVISLAIAIDIRVAGILIIPFMVVYHVLYMMMGGEHKPQLKPTAVAIAIISVTGYLGASIFWPFALQNPVSNPLYALSELSNFKMILAQLYEGERIPSTDLPKSYLIKNFFITSPYILIAGLCIFPFFIMKNDRKEKTIGLLFIAFTTIFPVLYIIYKGSNVYHAWRHILFVFPGAALLSAYGLDRLMTYFGSKSGRMAVAVLIGLGMLEPLSFIVGTYPNTVTYYNGFVGGVKSAYFNYETDYYYNSVKQAADWFKKNELPKIPKDKKIILGSNASHILLEYFRGVDNVEVRYIRFYERSMHDWDYGIFHRALVPGEMIENQSWVVNGTLFTAEVKGLPLCIVAKRLSKLDLEAFDLFKQDKTLDGIEKLIQYNKIDRKNEIVNNVLAQYFTARGREDIAAGVKQGKGIPAN